MLSTFCYDIVVSLAKYLLQTRRRNQISLERHFALDIFYIRDLGEMDLVFLVIVSALWISLRWSINVMAICTREDALWRRCDKRHRSSFFQREKANWVIMEVSVAAALNTY